MAWKNAQQLRESIQQRPKPTLSERVQALPQELIDIIHGHLYDDLVKRTTVFVDSTYRLPVVLQLNRTIRLANREHYLLNNYFLLEPSILAERFWPSMLLGYEDRLKPIFLGQEFRGATIESYSRWALLNRSW